MSSLSGPASRILFTCAGDTEQYEETIQALTDVAETYLAHLCRESLRLSTTPGTVKADDVIRALRCDPKMQTHVSDLYLDQRDLRKI